MKKIYLSLALAVFASGCESSQYKVSLSKPLTVTARNKSTVLPAGAYTMTVKGSLGGARISVQSSAASAQFNISKDAAYTLKTFIESGSSKASRELSQKDLGQPFAIKLVRSQTVKSTSAWETGTV